ncbi:MAG: DUF5343 domain-containing protein [Terrimicrobiaceae bacterium]|nr:DUF5343 domain-containing protein [Terrimicrobiaceae bacterium]
MGLTSTYVLPTNRISDVFGKIRDGQAPERVTIQLLKDWGFASKNDRAFVALLKALGFLSPDGKPTQRYHDYRDHSRSRAVMGEAVKEAYGDLFLIKAKPTDADKTAIEGKFKSFHNVSDNVAGLMTKTFYGLLSLADLQGETAKKTVSENLEGKEGDRGGASGTKGKLSGTNLHYNIQIHLPASKDLEVYNAIFKSLREHLLEQ